MPRGDLLIVRTYTHRDGWELRTVDVGFAAWKMIQSDARPIPFADAIRQLPSVAIRAREIVLERRYLAIHPLREPFPVGRVRDHYDGPTRLCFADIVYVETP